MMAVKKKTSRLFDIHQLDEMGVPIAHVVTDSRQVRPGDTFLAYPGERADGRNFIAQAIAAGANAIVWDYQDFSWNPEWIIPNLPVSELKSKAGLIADHVYGHPSQNLWVVGITGTNGKTSGCHWYAQAMANLSRKTAIIGTLGNGFVAELEGSENTTPDATVLQRMLNQFKQHGAESVAMEVSSHGIAQGRLNGTVFSVAVLTNLSRDHLDYHQDMDAYAATKARLFFWPGLKYAVVNMDDVLGVELSRQLANTSIQVIGYGFNYPEFAHAKHFSMVYGSNLQADIDGIEFDIEYEHVREHIALNVLGKFNASNVLAVVASLMASGIDLPDAIKALSDVRTLTGRMEKHGAADQPIVIVDYAHTPDALEKVLCTLREILRKSHTTAMSTRRPRLTCVVGCGGDRDKGKRPLIGEVATRLADSVIFTSDNPRTEDPQQIIRDIVAGATGRHHQIEVDRASAIYQAIDNARFGDVVLIAGKGHEKFQDVAGRKIPFDDAEIVQQVLNELTRKVRIKK